MLAGMKLGVVKLLLRHGAEAARTKGDCALSLTIACKQEGVEMVETLLPGGPTTVDLSNVVESFYGFGTIQKYGNNTENYSSSSSPMSPVNMHRCEKWPHRFVEAVTKRWCQSSCQLEKVAWRRGKTTTV